MENVPSSVGARFLGNRVHPIRPKIVHLYATRNQNTLWYRVLPGQPSMWKSVVRSWSTRRARAAFRESLRERGFDNQGKRIVGDFISENQSTHDEGQGQAQMENYGLKGSLDIVVLPESMKADYGTLKEDVDSLLDCMLHWIRRKRELEDYSQKQAQMDNDVDNDEKKVAGAAS